MFWMGGPSSSSVGWRALTWEPTPSRATRPAVSTVPARTRRRRPLGVEVEAAVRVKVVFMSPRCAALTAPGIGRCLIARLSRSPMVSPIAHLSRLPTFSRSPPSPDGPPRPALRNQPEGSIATTGGVVTAMDLHVAIDFARDRTQSVLVTARRNGRPQLSNVIHSVDDAGLVRISITADRAKYANLRSRPVGRTARDPGRLLGLRGVGRCRRVVARRRANPADAATVTSSSTSTGRWPASIRTGTTTGRRWSAIAGSSCDSVPIVPTGCSGGGRRADGLPSRPGRGRRHRASAGCGSRARWRSWCSMNNSSPISRLERPSPSKRSTSSSRAVSPRSSCASAAAGAASMPARRARSAMAAASGAVPSATTVRDASASRRAARGPAGAAHHGRARLRRRATARRRPRRGRRRSPRPPRAGVGNGCEPAALGRDQFEGAVQWLGALADGCLDPVQERRRPVQPCSGRGLELLAIGRRPHSPVGRRARRRGAAPPGRRCGAPTSPRRSRRSPARPRSNADAARVRSRRHSADSASQVAHHRLGVGVGRRTWWRNRPAARRPRRTSPRRTMSCSRANFTGSAKYGSTLPREHRRARRRQLRPTDRAPPTPRRAGRPSTPRRCAAGPADPSSATPLPARSTASSVRPANT